MSSLMATVHGKNLPNSHVCFLSSKNEALHNESVFEVLQCNQRLGIVTNIWHALDIYFVHHLTIRFEALVLSEVLLDKLCYCSWCLVTNACSVVTHAGSRVRHIITACTKLQPL